jgi:hypothetical protein
MNTNTPITSVGRRRAGFTLIEAALTTIIVGLGTVAIMGLLSSGLGANEQAAKVTTAVNLADNIHELCDRLSYVPTTTTTWGIPSGSNIWQLISDSVPTSNPQSNISWLNNTTFNPPVDSTETQLPSATWQNWQQIVSVTSVDPSNVNNASWPVANNTSPYKNQMARVTVTVYYASDPTVSSPAWQQMYQTSWLVTR